MWETRGAPAFRKLLTLKIGFRGTWYSETRIHKPWSEVPRKTPVSSLVSAFNLLLCIAIGKGCCCCCSFNESQKLSIKVCLPSKVILHWRWFSIEDYLQLKVIFRQRLSSIKYYIPLEVVFHQRSSSTEGNLPSKVVLHQRFSSIIVVFHQRSSYSECHLPLKVVFH